MKRFAVELCRTSYVTVMVDAESQEDAEEVALEEVELDPDWAHGNADWAVESIEEVNQ